MTLFFKEVAKREVFDISHANKFWIANLKHILHTPSQDRVKKMTELWYDEYSPKSRAMIFVDTAKTREGVADINTIRSFLVSLFNETRNNHGEYFQVFVGDRSTKEGISLLHTMHAVILDVAASAAMAAQSEARIRRNCSHRNFPHNRWSELILWRMINVPPIVSSGSGKKGRKGGVSKAKGDEFRTNEQWQYSFLSSSNPASLMILNELKSISLDCSLFSEYNRDVTCYGSAATNNQSSATEKDRFCVGAGVILLQDRNSASLSEILETKGNLFFAPAESYTTRCAAQQGINVEIPGTITYRDYLILQGINAIRDEQAIAQIRSEVANKLRSPSLNEAERKIGVGNVNLWLTLELLQSLGQTSTNDALRPDILLWSYAASLDQPHKAVISRFITSRLSAFTPEARQEAVTQADQITEWITRKVRLEKSRLVLLTLLNTLPTIADVQQMVFARRQ